ncbi:uncharacterized protein LOC127738821 [Mytilus californianus]|uniref:uncharacterized protein LOC127738821 n=1 Tax=Mytilus californianus TaxID=6549 RepID=UPI0022478CFB|nr:uncharacterized protein LOC127738821 [Mytilus californianus]XP_052106184.1 uncharacterized protein LOC127738821 [Mytilus californianus]XP_052106185.1 uncharacterized protein LOC127738821 [Mytilus californianus]
MDWNIQILIGLSSIGMLNLFYFLYMTKSQTTERVEPCSITTYLSAFTNFMDNNGKLQFSDSLSKECLGKAGNEVNMIVRKSVAQSIRECQLESARKIGRIPLNDNILTLFTSWSIESDKFHVHNNTVINWNTFMPRVNLVLFTNDSALSAYVRDRGWTSYPVTRHAAGGAPILKNMFQTVMNNFNSTFYAYANSDNLFDSSLLDTLSTVYNDLDNKKPLFISGRRTNVAFLTPKEAASYGNIQQAAKTRGELFLTNAQDYFITNKYFDWSGFPDLVIGRRAYDNWLVLRARAMGAKTVDASKTLLLVHQTTKGGNFEGHGRVDPNYNDDLILRLGLDRTYEKGFTTCMEYETFMSLCDETEVIQRNVIPDYCK